MGHKVKKPCAYQGCPQLVPIGTKYCEKHRGEGTKQGRDYEKARGTSTHRGYDSKWQAVRKQYLAMYPMCARCNRPAEMVDHIQPIAEGGARYVHENLQPMCMVCHRQKTEEDKRRVQRALG